ncbi:uncharacterized protein [Littorina saxatilis]|uniref:Speriolin C-terminal domain-containing protein n=2 Tax=Littorina saxatilis TaxID=31220 RepID=A0AAN9G6F3_9CAEN
MSGTSSNASMSSPAEAQSRPRGQNKGRSQSWQPTEEYDAGMYVTLTEKDVPQLEELHREQLMDNLRLWECINILRCNTRLLASNVLQQIYKQSDDDFFRNYPTYSCFELSGNGALSSTAEGGGGRHPEKYVQHLRVHNGGLIRENARLLLGLDLLNQSPDRSADEVICHCFALSDENFARHYPTAVRGSRLRATLNKMREDARSRQRSHSLPAHLQNLAFRRSGRPEKNNGPSCSNNNELYIHRESIPEFTPTALRIDPFCADNLKVQRGGPGSRHKNTPPVETRLARGGLGDPLGGIKADYPASDFPRRRHISSPSARPTSHLSGNRRAQAKVESGRPQGRSTDNSYQEVPYMVSHYPYNWATSNNSSIHIDPLDHADRGGGVGFLPEEDEEGGVVYRKHRLVPGNSKDLDVTGVGVKGPRISYSRSPASVSKQARFVDTGDMCESLDLQSSLEPTGKFGAKFSSRKGTTFPFTRFGSAERGLSPADSKRMAERSSGRRLSFGSQGPRWKPSSSAVSLASLKRSGSTIPSSAPFIIRRARSPEKKSVTFSGMPIVSPERERRGRSSRSPAGHQFEKPRPMYYKAPVEKREHLWSGEESNEEDDLCLPRHSSHKKDRSQSRERSSARRFHERSPARRFNERSPEQRFLESTPERRFNERSPPRRFHERSPVHRSCERSLPPSFGRTSPVSHRLNRSRSEDFSSSCTGHLDLNQSRNELLKLRERLREDELLSNYDIHCKKRSTFSPDNLDKLRPFEPSNTIIINPRNSDLDRSPDSSNRAKNRKQPTTFSSLPISVRASTSTSSLRDLSPRKEREKPFRTVSTTKIAPSADAYLDDSKTHRYPTQRQRRHTSPREQPMRSKELLQSTPPPHVDYTAPPYAESAHDENVNRHMEEYASSEHTDPATDSTTHRYPTQRQRSNTSPREQPKRSKEFLQRTPPPHVYYEAPPYAETAQDENVNRHMEEHASSEYTDQGAEVPFLERLMTLEDEENNILAELLEEKRQLDLKYTRDSSPRQNLSPRSLPTPIHYPEEPVDRRRYSLSNPTDGRPHSLSNPTEGRRFPISNPTDRRRSSLSDPTDGRRSSLLNPTDERRSSLSNPTDRRRSSLSNPTDGRRSSLSNPTDGRRSSLSNPTDGRRSSILNPTDVQRPSLSNPTDGRSSSLSDPCFPHCSRVTSPPNNEPSGFTDYNNHHGPKRNAAGFTDYNNHHSPKSNAAGFTEYTSLHSPNRNAAVFMEYNSHHSPETQAGGSMEYNSHHSSERNAAGFVEYNRHHSPKRNAAGFTEYNSHHSPERNAAGFVEYNSHHSPKRNAAGSIEYNSHHSPKTHAGGSMEYNSHHYPERNAAGSMEYNSHHSPQTNAAGFVEYNSHHSPKRNATGFDEYNSHNSPKRNATGSMEYNSHHSPQTNAAGFTEYNSHHSRERNAAGFVEYNSHHSPKRNAAAFMEYNSHNSPKRNATGSMEYNSHHSPQTNAAGFTEYNSHHSRERNAAGFVEYNSHHSPKRNAAAFMEYNSHHSPERNAAGFVEYNSHLSLKRNAAGFTEYNSHHSPNRNAAGSMEYNSHHSPQTNAAGFTKYNSHHSPERNAAGSMEYNSHHSPQTNAAGFTEYNSHHSPPKNAAGFTKYTSHHSPKRNAAGFTEYNSHHIPQTNAAGFTEYNSHHSPQRNASSSAIDDENTCKRLLNPVDELRLRTDRLHKETGKSRECRQHRSSVQEAALERACKGAYDNLGTPLVCPATRSHHHSKKNQNGNSHRYTPVPGWISMLSHEVPMKREDLDVHELSESTHKKLEELTGKAEAARKAYYDAPAALLGEVAFQLERRIIRQVFHEKKSSTSNKTDNTGDNRFDNNDTRHRFYGFTVLNIPEKIRAETREPRTLKRNCAREAVLLRRFQDVITFLRDNCQYFVHKHGKLCQDLINKHGLFNQPPDVATITRLGLDDFRSVRNHVIKLSDKEERQDMLVIVDCLRALALKEDKPILSFE